MGKDGHMLTVNHCSSLSIYYIYIYHIPHTSLPLQRAADPNGSIEDRPPSSIIWLRIQSQGNQGTLTERHKNRLRVLVDVKAEEVMGGWGIQG